MEDLRIVHAFVERAESSFRDMFGRLLEAIEAGRYDVTPHTVSKVRADVVKVIDRLRKSTPADSQYNNRQIVDRVARSSSHGKTRRSIDTHG